MTTLSQHVQASKDAARKAQRLARLSLAVSLLAVAIAGTRLVGKLAGWWA